MMQAMLKMNFSALHVLDMGCGTGILSILASLKMAQSVIAADIEKWACENAIENLEKNNILNAKVLHGSIDKVKNTHFDIILANINRNAILGQLKSYSVLLSEKGSLLVSGILQEDVKAVIDEAALFGFAPSVQKSKGKWHLIILNRIK
jgi:ribosomal protein L11 methyltransferase